LYATKITVSDYTYCSTFVYLDPRRKSTKWCRMEDEMDTASLLSRYRELEALSVEDLRTLLLAKGMYSAEIP